MNLEGAISVTGLRRERRELLRAEGTKAAKEIAVLVYDMAAAIGEPYTDSRPEQWAKRWLASRRFHLVEIDPRQVAVPLTEKISASKVNAIMQASADALEPIIVDINKNGIGVSSTGYVPKVIVVDGKNRHRSRILCGNDRIQAWVGDDALAELKARAKATKRFVVEAHSGTSKPLMSPIASATILGSMGGSPLAVTRQDTGDGGPRPTGSTHAPVGMKGNAGASGAGGPGGGVSGLNPSRRGMFASDPSDRKQMLDPSDKKQFSLGDEPDDGDPEEQSPGSGVGPRVRPDLSGGPVSVKKIVTDKKKKKKMDAAGSSEGARKGWDTRGRGRKAVLHGIVKVGRKADHHIKQGVTDALMDKVKEHLSKHAPEVIMKVLAELGLAHVLTHASAVAQSAALLAQHLAPVIHHLVSTAGLYTSMLSSADGGLSPKQKKIHDWLAAEIHAGRLVLAVAPPGREDEVMELKKKFGGNSDMPYKIAWSQESGAKR